MASQEELIYDPIGALFDGSFQPGAYGGHQDHVHIALNRHRGELLRLLLWAQRHGLHVGENPYFDPVDPVHTEGSFHYQTFKKPVRGRTLGKAADVSGTPQQMARFFRVARRALEGGPLPGGGRSGGGGRGRSGNAAALLSALQPVRIEPQQLAFQAPSALLAALAPRALPEQAAPESLYDPAGELEALRQRLLGAQP